MSADSHERELWALLHTVETDTATHYRKVAPQLAPPEKEEAIRAIRDELLHGTTLEGSVLAAPLARLLASAEGDGSVRDVALLQGVLLEQLGVTLYGILAENGRLSARGTAIARRAGAASREASTRATQAVREALPDPTERFAVFASRSGSLLADLDALGEALDTRFSERLDLHFADVMGDFVADLLPCCVDELGFERRKVVVHLTGALMR